MTKTTLCAASLLSLLMAGAPSAEAAQRASNSRPELTVRLYNHAGAPPKMLDAAAEVGRRIFERAGLATTWVTCGVRPEQPGQPSCEQLPGKSVLRVNVLDREMASKLGTAPEAFGVAFPAKKGFGLVASVFHHRVAELERDSGLDGSLIFGHILAHEIGHLLLGFKSHTQRGIMTGQWDEVQMTRAQQGSFNFFESQARRMRKQVAARMRADTESRLNRRALAYFDA